MKFSVSSNAEEVRRELRLAIDEMRKAAVRATNKVAGTARAEASRDLGEHYPGLKVLAIRKRIRFDRATQGKAIATLNFGSQRLRLINWSVSQTRSGVHGRMPATLLRIDAVSGFASRISQGQLRQAFIRSGGGRNQRNVWLRQGRDRYPIDVIVTPSLSESMVEHGLVAVLGRVVQQRFPVVMRQEAKFLVSKRR